MKLSLGEPFRMFCDIVGLPDPEINWYKNGLLIENDTRISPSPDMKTLDIKYLKIEDDGEFKCVGENRLGTVEKSATLKITSKAFDKQDKNKLLKIFSFARSAKNQCRLVYWNRCVDIGFSSGYNLFVDTIPTRTKSRMDTK